MKNISLAEAEYISHSLVNELMDYGEPVPPFNTRFPGRLESCLQQPFTYLNGRYVYWTLPHRAAVMFYMIIKNHPFENGNKRMAVTIMLVFLYKNKRWLSVSPDSLYSLAKTVAESLPAAKDDVIKILKDGFTETIQDL